MDVDPDKEGTEDCPQPTLCDILEAVQKCTDQWSVDDLKEQFGGLREELSLIRQD